MKVILFDADGVVIKKRNGYFSDYFVQTNGAPAEEVKQFFKTTFKECQAGRADLKDELSKRLAGWGWSGSVEEFLELWFGSEKELDEDVLAVVASLRTKGVVCCMVTDQEKYRARYVLDVLGLRETFDHAFFSCDLGYSKDEPEFFKAVCESLKLEPHEVQYWDDDPKNVAVARELGIDARIFTSIRDFYSSNCYSNVLQNTRMKGDPVPALPADAPKAGEVYRHYKGDNYRVVLLAEHSNDNEWMVVYEPMYENADAPYFTRPLREWREMVDLPAGGQGGEGQKVERFRKV